MCPNRTPRRRTRRCRSVHVADDVAPVPDAFGSLTRSRATLTAAPPDQPPPPARRGRGLPGRRVGPHVDRVRLRLHGGRNTERPFTGLLSTPVQGPRQRLTNFARGLQRSTAPRADTWLVARQERSPCALNEPPPWPSRPRPPSSSVPAGSSPRRPSSVFPSSLRRPRSYRFTATRRVHRALRSSTRPSTTPLRDLDGAIRLLRSTAHAVEAHRGVRLARR